MFSFLKYNHVIIYIISQDTLFVQEIEQHIRLTHKNVQIIIHTTGEGFFQNHTFNPPSSKATFLILLDYNLKSRDHITAQNGLTILQEIKKEFPKWDIVLFASPQDILIKRKALKKGALAFIVKNNNSRTRLTYIIQNILNQKKLEFEKRLTWATFISFSAVGSILVILAFFIYKWHFA